MSKEFVFLLMIFCHIIDDYNLQGWLASAKQKEWWMKNAPGKMYEHDYIVALIIHSFSWAFMIMLPVAIYYGFEISPIFLLMMGINVYIHAVVDDLKANKKKINLWVDQIIHFFQIIVTYYLMLI